MRTLLSLAVDQPRLAVGQLEQAVVGEAAPFDRAPLVRGARWVPRADRASPVQVRPNVARVARVGPGVVQELAVADLVGSLAGHLTRVVGVAVAPFEHLADGAHHAAVGHDDHGAVGLLGAVSVEIGQERGVEPQAEPRHRLARGQGGVEALFVELAGVLGEALLALDVAHHVHESVVALAELEVEEPLGAVEAQVPRGLDTAQVLAREVAIEAAEVVGLEPESRLGGLPHPLVSEPPATTVATGVLGGVQAVVAFLGGVASDVAFGLTVTDEDEISW